MNTREDTTNEDTLEGGTHSSNKFRIEIKSRMQKSKIRRRLEGAYFLNTLRIKNILPSMGNLERVNWLKYGFWA